MAVKIAILFSRVVSKILRRFGVPKSYSNLQTERDLKTFLMNPWLENQTFEEQVWKRKEHPWGCFIKSETLKKSKKNMT